MGTTKTCRETKQEALNSQGAQLLQ